MPMIPKLLHFIWAGGANIMSDDALLNVVAWATLNPDFIVKIWVDERTDPAVRDKYKNALERLLPGQTFNNIEIVDIVREGVCTPQIRYELDHLMPNYGASSDQLRYEILWQQGGMHIDCKDVFPKKNLSLSSVVFPPNDPFSGNKVFGTDLPNDRLLLHMTPHSYLGHGKEAPGTEAMACTVGHPRMRQLADTANHAYQSTKWTYKLQKFIYAHFGKYESKNAPKKDKMGSMASGRHLVLLQAQKKSMEGMRVKSEVFIDQEELKKRRAQETLRLTGPEMAVSVLNIQDATRATDYLMPHDKDRLTDWVELPEKHAESWAPIKFVPHDRDTAILKAIEAIKFEADEMRIFNIYAHVEQIAGSLVTNGIINDESSLEQEKKVIEKEIMDRLVLDTQRFKQIGEKLILNTSHTPRKTT